MPFDKILVKNEKKYKLSADGSLMLKTHYNPVHISRVTRGDCKCLDVP